MQKFSYNIVKIVGRGGSEVTTSDDIYQMLKKRILAGEYSIKMRLPTEDELISELNTSRYSIRKAIQQLANDGLVHGVKGKGVVILENDFQSQKINLNFDKIDDLQSTKQNFDLNQQINIISFKLKLVDETLSKKTLFPIGLPIYTIKRVRTINNKKLVLDLNYFNAQIAPDLTPEIASKSIYAYLRDSLNMHIAVIKKQLRIERTSDLDQKHLSLDGANCVGNMINFAYNDDGKLFEYTESHFIPDSFVFNQIITF